jgi:uncharacterized protein YbjT (DUF2867 family)
MKKIAIIGATGMLGKPVTIELVNSGFEVTALARDQVKAKRLLPEDVKIVQADLRDIESLKRGLRDQNALYLSLAVAPRDRSHDFHAEAEGLSNVLMAARFTSIKRIAYLSALIQDRNENDWWVIEVWRSAIAQIKSSGIPYTIFYASNFMETLSHRHVQVGLLALTGRSHYRNFWIAGKDYGRQVARSLETARAENRDYFVQGPEPLTYDEAAHRFAINYKKKLVVVRIPLALLKWLGAFSQTMDFNFHIMHAVLSYPEEFKAGETWKELGRPSTTIEEFAKSL